MMRSPASTIPSSAPKGRKTKRAASRPFARELYCARSARPRHNPCRLWPAVGCTASMRSIKRISIIQTICFELDRMEFEVAEAPELGRKAGDLRPIVVVTHNEEKPLPPAFLRRCVYHYVEFPKTRASSSASWPCTASRRMTHDKVDCGDPGLRSKDLNKKPGLTELIDWVWYQQALTNSRLKRWRSSKISRRC